MKTLWTPWRIEHVLGEAKKADHNIFDPPVEGNNAKEHLLLFRNSTVVVLLNRFPYANGHLLAAPRRKVAEIVDLKGEEHSQLMVILGECTRILREVLNPDGFNLGCNLGEVAGAGIAEHLHFHVVPRWEGDHNFITVMGELRTIPEHIEATFDKLLPCFLALAKKDSLEKPFPA
jgi:ATP adenylyltransferase